jgi:hypothetical protein
LATVIGSVPNRTSFELRLPSELFKELGPGLFQAETADLRTLCLLTVSSLWFAFLTNVEPQTMDSGHKDDGNAWYLRGVFK